MEHQHQHTYHSNRSVINHDTEVYWSGLGLSRQQIPANGRPDTIESSDEYKVLMPMYYHFNFRL